MDRKWGWAMSSLICFISRNHLSIAVSLFYYPPQSAILLFFTAESAEKQRSFPLVCFSLLTTLQDSRSQPKRYARFCLGQRTQRFQVELVNTEKQQSGYFNITAEFAEKQRSFPPVCILGAASASSAVK